MYNVVCDIFKAVLKKLYPYEPTDGSVFSCRELWISIGGYRMGITFFLGTGEGGSLKSADICVCVDFFGTPLKPLLEHMQNYDG